MYIYKCINVSIIMISKAIEVLYAVLDEQMSIQDLTKVIGLKYRRTAEIVEDLVQQNFLVRTDYGKIDLASTALATSFRKISRRYDMVKLLGDSRKEILVALLNSETVQRLQSSTQLSYRTIRRALVKLMETGAVSEKNRKYTVVEDQDLQFFITILKEEKQRRSVESYAEVVYVSPDFIFKKVPEGKNVKGSPTAFSVFSRYGVELRPVYAYYIQPEVKLTIEDVLVHAMIFSTNPVELTDCTVFYAKNRDKIDLGLLRKLAHRFDITDIIMDIENYVRNLTVSAPEKFLPWDEFAEKIRLYGVSPESLLPPQAFPDFMNEIAQRIKSEVSLYVFGGEAMRIRGLKRATKDVDMVVQDPQTFITLKEALIVMRYRELGCEEFLKIDKVLNPSGIFVKDGSPRVDLFVESICNKFHLSKSMMNRCEINKIGLMNFYVMSNEDVFLLKSVTDREGDITDMILLAKAQGFDWNIVSTELYNQEQETKKHFCMNFLDSIEAIEKRSKIKAPFHNQLVNHCIDKAILDLVGQWKVTTFKQIRKLIQYPDYRLRSRIEKLILGGKIKKRKNGQFTVYANTACLDKFFFKAI